MLATFPKHLLEDLSAEGEDSPNKESSETMTHKEVEMATKLNTFLDEARRANTLSEEQFGPTSAKKQCPLIERPSLKLHHSYFGQDW